MERARTRPIFREYSLHHGELAQKQVAFRSSMQDPNKKEPIQLQVNCLRCRRYTAPGMSNGIRQQRPDDEVQAPTKYQRITKNKREDCRNVQQYIKERK